MGQRELRDFLKLFEFKSDMGGFVGVEREHFLQSERGDFAPLASDFLRLMADSRWTYELSACQVEDRTRPQKDFSAIEAELLENNNDGALVAGKMGLRLTNVEVAAEGMPPDIYPDPRYLAISRRASQDMIMAARRVIGTHLHFGVEDVERALWVYNAIIPHLDELCRIGDHSAGKRMELYKTMATNWQPPSYRHVGDLFETACAQGFAKNPRDCWHLVRISVHGTVELRMFGASNHVDEIMF